MWIDALSHCLTHCAGSGVVRIDPLRFLAGCRKKRLNQAPAVLSQPRFLMIMYCAVNWDSF